MRIRFLFNFLGRFGVKLYTYGILPIVYVRDKYKLRRKRDDKMKDKEEVKDQLKESLSRSEIYWSLK